MTGLGDRPVVYLITSGEARPETFDRDRSRISVLVSTAVEEGVTIVQIREKRLTAREIFELARDAANITRGSTTRLVINERADIAIAAGADGVQLTSRSLSPDVVRRIMPEGSLIGVSTHSVSEMQRVSGADFAVFGPVFETPGKAAVGSQVLSAACSATGIPVIAIGGIDESNAASVTEAGAAGVAAIRSLGTRASIRAVIAALKK